MSNFETWFWESLSEDHAFFSIPFVDPEGNLRISYKGHIFSVYGYYFPQVTVQKDDSSVVAETVIGWNWSRWQRFKLGFQIRRIANEAQPIGKIF